MKAVIMAGGKGTRLWPLTSDQPKPMVPVANRPMLDHLIHLLKRHGFDEIFLTTHYLSDRIKRALGDGRRHGVALRVVVEEVPMGTAGSVKQLEKELDETFLVISGDCLTDFPLGDAFRRHRSLGSVATMVVTEVEDPSEYGIVAHGADGRIERFLEKPRPGEVFSCCVNTGVYVLEPEAIAACASGRPVDFSRDLFPDLIARGAPIYAVRGEGYWSDIGNCPQYIRSQVDALNGRVKLSLPEPVAPGVWIEEGAAVDPTAQIVPPVMIGHHAVVEAQARVGPGVVLGPGAKVGRGAVVESSVVWEQAEVGAGARMRGAAVGRAAVIETGAVLFDGTAVGDRVKVRASLPLRPGAKLFLADDGLTVVSG